MGRAQIKKKSTFIDMTAMSDVTVLLADFLYVDFNICEERTGASYHSGFRIGNQDSGDKCASDSGRSGMGKYL